VSTRRCPSCGGLVSADLEWCSQCFTRLDDRISGTSGTAARESPATAAEPPDPSTSEASAETTVTPTPDATPSPNGHGGPRSAATGPKPAASPFRAAGQATEVRVEEGRILWTCPLCGSENPLETESCARCGTPFGKLFEEPEAAPPVSAERAAALSLLFPGAGHVAARRVADGVARGIVFALALTMVLAILVAGGGLGGPLTPLLLLFGGAGAIVYAASAVDAARAVRGDSPVLGTRVLLIGATVLLGLAVVVLVLGGSRLSGG
jgi:hypothetical protein